MNLFENALTVSYVELEEASNPMSKAQKEKVKKMKSSGWKMEKRDGDKVVMTKSGKEVFIYTTGKSFFLSEGEEVDVTDILEELSEDSVNENFLGNMMRSLKARFTKQKSQDQLVQKVSDPENTILRFNGSRTDLNKIAIGGKSPKNVEKYLVSVYEKFQRGENVAAELPKLMKLNEDFLDAFSSVLDLNSRSATQYFEYLIEIFDVALSAAELSKKNVKYDELG